MPMTPPPLIDPLPPPPDPDVRDTFDELAYPWTAALDPYTDQVNALAQNVYENALAAADIVRGEPGPPGPPGAEGSSTRLGGIPLAFSSLQAGDVITFSGTAWANTTQYQITDGGNF